MLCGRDVCSELMRLLIAVTLLTVTSCAQKPAEAPQKLISQRLTQTPSLQLIQTADSAAIIDTDMFDAQKYVEQAGGGSVNEKTKRSSHEVTLTQEFFKGFDATTDCDGILLVSRNGDEEPQFNLQVMVDSHDTPGQKPVWLWILSGARREFITKGEEDSSALTARNVCLSVWKAAEREQLRASQPLP